VNDSELLQSYSFYYCVLDEAQHIKNQQTQRAKECKKIQSQYRLAITGTPLENRLEDLWSLFDFLMPGYLESQNQFRAKYVEPLKKSGLQASLAILKQKIAPFMLRRLKKDVLPELPAKIVTVRNVLMSQLQEDVYRTILKQVKQEILNSITTRGLEKSRLTVLSAITKLRQLCDHPSLALAEISPEADSGKIDALMELINEAIDGGHKIVVFSQFVRMLKLIRAKFAESGISYVYLDGSTQDRMERINCFNNTPEIPVFLISLKAGGVGINLTAADIVIHADPWWNPMVEDQATDRVHRIGQQNQVMVYKLITIGTVEEKLIKLQTLKRAVFDAVIQNNGDPINTLTWEDIQELLDMQV
jgi:SNF2 family DNA or RNA helicase